MSCFSKFNVHAKLGRSVAAVVVGAVLTLSVSANAMSISGTRQSDVLNGTALGNQKFNGRNGFDRIEYPVSTQPYRFERVSLKDIRATKGGTGIDNLRNIEAVSFGENGDIFDFNRIFSPLVNGKNIVIYQGAEISEVFPGFLIGNGLYSGDDGVDKVEYEGLPDQYTFKLQDDGGSVNVIKPNGDVDQLLSIERISFGRNGIDYNIEDLLPAARVVDPNQLFHFGEPVSLVGANIPWSDDSRFSSDFGRSDGFGNPDTNLIGFQAKFDEIVQNGGNSARIWLHTTAQITPNIDIKSRTVGLSRELTNQQVIAQLEAVLDSAWDRGILVTFSLFSFDMLCDHYENDFGYTGSMVRNRRMLKFKPELYFDNALTPMVNGLKDHPALFAYEIFNEPEGAYSERVFCETSQPLNKYIAARFVNNAAAVIHALDPNVKVTTSTHTDLVNDFSNATLLSLDGANPAGTLDFYELHWYAGWGKDPFTTPVSSYNLDRPIIIGEFDVEQAAAVSSMQSEDAISVVLGNGYSGAWPWSLATLDDAQPIREAISEAQVTPIDKVAIETCIRDKTSDCYLE